jgi:hemolysin activation/secretion protein
MEKYCKSFGLGALCLWSIYSNAQTIPEGEAERQLIRTQEQRQQQQDLFKSDVDVRLQATVNDSFNQWLPEQESPCFQIDQLTLQAVDAEGQALSQHPFLWAAEAAHTIEVNVEVNTDMDANPRARVLDTPIGR